MSDRSNQSEQASFWGNIVLAAMLETLETRFAIKSLGNVMLVARAIDLRFTNRRIRAVQKDGAVLGLCVEISMAKSWAENGVLRLKALTLA